MKNLLLTLSLSLLFCDTTSAQAVVDIEHVEINGGDSIESADANAALQEVRGGEFRHHEIGLSYGLATGPQISNLYTEFFTFSLAKVDLRSTGSFAASYLYFHIKHIGVGGTIAYQQGNEPVDARFECKQNYVTALATAKFYWFNRPHVGMYSSIALGATYSFGHYEGEREQGWRFSGQVNAVCIEAGGRVRGFLEAGFGTLGLLKMGIRYKF